MTLFFQCIILSYSGSLIFKDDIQPVVEGNINTVGLPDTELPGFVIPRRQNTATQPLEPLHHSSSSSSNQGILITYLKKKIYIYF